jgi:EF hand
MAQNAARLTVLLAIAGMVAAAKIATAAYPTPVNGMITDAIAGIDRNENGSIEADEWHVAGDRTFAAIDSDRDGNISREEFALIRGVMFPVMDTNHDGKVSTAEADAYKRLPWTLGLFR